MGRGRVCPGYSGLPAAGPGTKYLTLLGFGVFTGETEITNLFQKRIAVGMDACAAGQALWAVRPRCLLLPYTRLPNRCLSSFVGVSGRIFNHLPSHSIWPSRLCLKLNEYPFLPEGDGIKEHFILRAGTRTPLRRQDLFLEFTLLSYYRGRERGRERDIEVSATLGCMG